MKNQSLSLISRTCFAVTSSINAFKDPTKADQVAILGEVTGPYFLNKIREKMLLDRTGRKILREKPIISSSTLNLDMLNQYEENTFGKEYAKMLKTLNISPDTRSQVQFIEDKELAYIMTRYRQVHDFWHLLTGLGVSVEDELLLKWLEFTHMGLPVAAISSIFGPFRLNDASKFWEVGVPWAISCANNSKYLMNVYYEEVLAKDIDLVRQELNFIPYPKKI